jgi:hypothetical protein
LKQCAKLRAQFLPYFVDGTLVGDCVLGEPCPDAAVGTYILKDRLLAIVLNTGPRRAIALNGDLGPWMPPGTGGYEIRCFDGAGGLVRTVASAQASVRLVTDPLEPLDFTVFEIVGR